MSNRNINRKRYTALLKLGSMSVPQKIETARHYVAQITSRPGFFVAPGTLLADVLSAAQQLELAWEQSRDGSRTAIRTMYNRESDLDYVLKKLAHYVEDIANETNIADMVITGAGMQFHVSSGPSARNFRVQHGELKGTAKAVTKAVKGSTSYVWERRQKGSTDWVQAAITVKASYLFTGLTSLTVYEFRQKTITSAGESDWTDVIELSIL